MRGHMWLNKVASVLGLLDYMCETRCRAEIFKFSKDRLHTVMLIQARIQGGGGIWGMCPPPLQPNAQQKIYGD